MYINKLYITIIILTISAHTVFASTGRTSALEYINTYKKIAVDEMKRSGIPASVTLAQGMLESANGNSTLAIRANNHFGIKCHKWPGKTFYQDDDAKDECFRKYNSAEESFRDHTDFIVNTNRYSFLFNYKSDDYKSWAKGLKKAGYATSPSYATDLIRIIEENQLHIYDNGEYTQEPRVNSKADKKSSNDYFFVDIKRRKISLRNNIKYIVVEKGDNLARITQDMNLMRWELTRYNEIADTTTLVPGQILYIQPKRWRAEKGNDFHIAKAGETMHSISQLYGIKINRLYRKNRMEKGQSPTEGQKIWLRSRKPRNGS